ncbi:two-component system sensor histidine kinase YesM [Faecalicatena orotica]|uniref:Two-component system sensor histidine kinase YesM n=1 Tax=Faecalicatena orotica TaxID=1544 RepID=A0A2Y9C688_9FIRM|nr:histidine kinase [Faecalicatena orotica]PWJ23427.1 two-component system sensor histidine kinase YesM [Faecalicatena orotica]SSA57685.1 two-component system, sensor histidine kinase YesM [Faecalicatena orotica]
MKFQKKIILVYTIFSVLITGIFGAAYYTLNVRQYKEREYGNIRTVSNVKLQQMEDTLESMESAITYVLSDIEVLDALKKLATLKTDSYADMYFSDSTATVRAKINSYYLMEEFYRMVFFNKNGRTIANNNYTNTALNTDASYQTYPWVERVSGKGGRNVLIGLHEDDWGSRSKPQVISVVKEIQGMEMGYLEVQKDKASLDKMIANTDENITYIFMTKEGEFLYSDARQVKAEYYWNLMQGRDKDIEEIETADGEKALCLMQESDTDDIVLMTVARMDISQSAAMEVLPVSLLLLFVALALSLGYIYLTSRQLTRPIQQLQHFMETTRLDNMEAEIPEKISNDEIESLYVSYKDVLNRLNTSMLKEKRMSLLSLQAQFDLLQAQVNPHFIYNVLNVISNRGMVSDDEVICDICSELAGMLRYSTNTKDKYASVKQEIEYLELYLGLLKHRYDYKLSYEIRIDEALYNKPLPKIVLQQIVENAVNHGYGSSSDIIRVEVAGALTEDGWFLKVHDDGNGITKEKLDEINNNISSIRNKLTNDRSGVELEIGGMGLLILMHACIFCTTMISYLRSAREKKRGRM